MYLFLEQMYIIHIPDNSYDVSTIDKGFLLYDPGMHISRDR